MEGEAMRGLSELELRGLVHMIEDPSYTSTCKTDPIIDAWKSCADRGLATYRKSVEVSDDTRITTHTWVVNDLGRLALRVHYAVTQES